MPQVQDPKLQGELVDFFSIDDDSETEYAPFRPANMCAIFRAFNEVEAKKNVLSLYKRANLKAPAWASKD